MSDEAGQEVYRQFRTVQDKYTYFLLAAAGAAIAFSLNQTHSLPLSWQQAPLALAVISWAASFYFGCQHARYIASSLYSNLEWLRIAKGEHPDVGSHPQAIEAACAGIQEALTFNSERAERYSNWQFRLLVVGALLYITWHVVEMWLRAQLPSVLNAT